MTDNGNGETKSNKGLLDELAKEAPSKPDIKLRANLFKKYRALEKERAAAEEALDKALSAQSECVAEIVRSQGKGPFRDKETGRLLTPSASKGGKFFFRAPAASDVIEV